MTNTVKKYMKKLEFFLEKRRFDKLTPGQQTSYIKNLLKQQDEK